METIAFYAWAKISMLILTLVILGTVLIFLAGISILALSFAPVREKLDDWVGGSIIGNTTSKVSRIGAAQSLGRYRKATMTSATNSMANKSEAPPVWDERFISERLRQDQENPELVKYFITSVIKRFIIGQDSRTSETRKRFLEGQITELKITKDYLTARDSLELHEIEREIKRRKLDLEREDLENKRIAQQGLDKLVLDRDMLKVKLEITQLSKQIDEAG